MRTPMRYLIPSLLLAFTTLLFAQPFPLPVPQPGAPAPTPPLPRCAIGVNCGEIRWDFEDQDRDGRGDLRGWTGSGSFFGGASRTLQPTYGENVSLGRILRNHPPPNLTSLRSLLDLGGSYWDVPWPHGFQGSFWIGTFEARPTSTAAFNTIVGDAGTGEMVSPTFHIDQRYIKFLAGGTCGGDVGIVLEELATRRVVVPDCSALLTAADAAHANAQRRCPMSSDCAAAIAADTAAQSALSNCIASPTRIEDVATPTWEPVRVFRGYRNNDAHQPIYSDYRYTPSATCSEMMVRVSWETQPIVSRGETATYRLRILDRSSTSHISADDFWITDRTSVPEPPAQPLAGFADLHTHPAAHLAFGGMLFGGTPAGLVPGPTVRGIREPAAFWADMDVAGPDLRPWSSGPPTACHNNHSYGLTCNTAAAPVALDRFTVGARTPFPRPYGRFRDGLHIPTWYNASYQMMHINWIRRAYDGGLRLLVADAVNSRPMTWLLNSNPGEVPPTDSVAIEKQFDYITKLVAANSDWMEIVLSPPHARRVIASGKLAVVLGTEVDAYGECNEMDSWIRESGANVQVTRRCSWSNVVAALDRFTVMGQRKITPIHFADNAFGGFALYSEIFNSSNNWNNRGDFGNLCGNPRMPLDMCPSVPASTRNLDALLSASIFGRPPGRCQQAADLTVGDNGCRQYLGWAQVRDGSAFLGPEGFQLPGKELYMTISHNPVPGANFSGCVGAGWCAAPAEQRIGLPGYSDNRPDANVLGLTSLGRSLVGELMRRGLIIDVQHMSERGVNEMLGLVDLGLGSIPGPTRSAVTSNDEGCNRLDLAHLETNTRCRNSFYPVMSSHTGIRYLPSGSGAPLAGQNENARSLEQVRRIYQTGGVVGIGTVGGTQSFSRAFRDVRDLLGDDGIAAATDFNGGDAGAPPRLMRWACNPTATLPGADQPFVRYQGVPEPSYTETSCDGPVFRVTYRNSSREPPLKPLLLPSYVNRIGSGTPLDINRDGFANIGMYPDYLQELRAVSVGAIDMGSLFRSAERVIQQWEKSCSLSLAIDHSTGDNNRSCRCDPKTPEGRPFCPQGSPGLN